MNFDPQDLQSFKCAVQTLFAVASLLVVERSENLESFERFGMMRVQFHGRAQFALAVFNFTLAAVNQPQISVKVRTFGTPPTELQGCIEL